MMKVNDERRELQMKVRMAEEQRHPPHPRPALTGSAGASHKGRPDLFKYGQRKYTDDQLKEILHDKQRPVFAAVDENDCLHGYAFCIFQQHLNDNILTDIKTLYIDDLCVDETKRGMHIGKTIYDAVLDFAREQGCYNVTLNVWSCNESAMKFYEKCGLKPQKVGMEVILATAKLRCSSTCIQTASPLNDRTPYPSSKKIPKKRGLSKCRIISPVSSVFLFNILL